LCTPLRNSHVDGSLAGHVAIFYYVVIYLFIHSIYLSIYLANKIHLDSVRFGLRYKKKKNAQTTNAEIGMPHVVRNDHNNATGIWLYTKLISNRLM
jgi:hypothetical protein